MENYAMIHDGWIMCRILANVNLILNVNLNVAPGTFMEALFDWSGKKLARTCGMLFNIRRFLPIDILIGL